jgi:hypothetical protein
MLRHVMYPKLGWFILHGVAITLVFLLGYSVSF